jgi:hypothetical protein
MTSHGALHSDRPTRGSACSAAVSGRLAPDIAGLSRDVCVNFVSFREHPNYVSESGGLRRGHIRQYRSVTDSIERFDMDKQDCQAQFHRPSPIQ